MGKVMSAEAVEARKAYQREYRRRNRDKINSRRKNWRAENREKVQRYNREYWERRAEKARNIRASYADYGITPERLGELTGIVRSGLHDDLVQSAARRADEQAAGHIVLSVKRNMSYETLEARQAAGEIERVAIGRSDFYGARRLFFHYLDIALREMKAEKSKEVKNG